MAFRFGFAGFLAFCSLCVALLAVNPARAGVSQRVPVSAVAAEDIEVFVREGCPHCDKAKEFLGTLGRERAALHIVIRDIRQDPQALARLQQIAESQGVSARVPAFFVRGQLIVGYMDESTTGRLIRDGLYPAAP